MVSRVLSVVSLVAMASQVGAADPSASELVQLLGNHSFDQRQQAAAAIVELGENARPALSLGLKSDDLEIRRASRRLLDELAEVDYQRQIQALLKDESAQLDLPGWRRYVELVGDGPEARKLFVRMLQQERGLLETLHSQGRDMEMALRLRSQQLWNRVYRNTNSRTRKYPDAATLAAELLAVSELKKVPVEMVRMINLFQQDPAAKELKSSADHPARKLLEEFIFSLKHESYLQQSIGLCLTLNMKESGLRLGARVIKNAKARQTRSVAMCVGLAGALGGREYSALLVPLLDDERSCNTRRINNKTVHVQVRDVAIAWLVHMSGQNLNDYGLQHAAPVFNTIKRSPQSALHAYGNVRFDNDASRQKALTKIREWLKKNPPAKVELEPAPEPTKDIAASQRGPVVNVNNGVPSDDDQSLPVADYLVVKQLREAARLIEQSSFAEAVGVLGRIVAETDDSVFKPEPSSTLYRSVRAEAESLLGSLPVAGLKWYEATFGPQATVQFEQGLADSQVNILSDVARKYLYTDAGWESACLLGRYYLEVGQPWQAAVYLQRALGRRDLAADVRRELSTLLVVAWLAAGDEEAARRLLAELTVNGNSPELVLGGQRIPFGDGDADAAAQLSKTVALPGRGKRGWFVARGARTGNRRHDIGPPGLQSKPLTAAAGNTFIASTLQSLNARRRERHQALIHTVEPLIVGDLLIRRTPTGLQALHRSTGKQVWEVAAENSLNHFLEYSTPDQQKRFADTIADSMRERLWENAAWGALSTDGTLLFAVEDLSFEIDMDYNRIVTRQDGGRQLDTSAYDQTNVLTAFQIESGKRVWQAGTAFGETTDALQGGRFLAPPLPLDDHLYAVVAFEESTQLVLLGAKTGEVLRKWVLEIHDGAMQRPNTSTQTFAAAPVSHTAPPVFARGLLVCGTSSGRFVAVDVVSGATIWSYRVNPKQPPAAIGINIAGMKQIMDKSLSRATDRWSDNAATIFRGRVLAVARDSDELHCLDLKTGKFLWKTWRRDGVYVGGCTDDTVLIVGRGGVTGIRLEDGKPAWKNEVTDYPEGAILAGRGYLSESRYFVPLDNGEIVGVDSASGQIASHVLPARSNTPIQLGNLLPLDDALYSSSTQSVRQFELLGAADDPDNVLVALAAGDAQRVVQLLKSGKASDTANHLRALLLALQMDPRQIADHVDLIERLLHDERPQQVHDLLIVAGVLTDLNRPEMALKVYEQILSRPDNIPDEVRAVAAGRRIHTDRRLAAGINRLMQVADPALASRIQDTLLPLADAAKTPRALGRFGNRVDAVPQRRLSLAAELAAANRRLSAEVLLNQAVEPQSAERQRTELSKLLAAAGQPLAAAQYAANEPSNKSAWHDVNWKVTDTKQTDQTMRTDQQFPVIIESAGDDPQIELSATYGLSSRKLTVVDRWGKTVAEVTLPQATGNNARWANPYSSAMHGMSIGHLLIVFRGDLVAGIDCLSGKGKILWTSPSVADDTTMQQQALMMNQWRMRLMVFGAARGSTIRSRMLIAAADYVCFQRGNELLAVDPLTGELLWSRDDFAAMCDLVGDADQILVTPSGSETTTVLSPVDGSVLARCPAVASDERLAVIGRRVVRRITKGAQHLIGLYDLRDESFVWSREIKSDSVLAVTRSRIGIVQPDGMIYVVDGLAGGELLVNRVEAFETLLNITLFPRADSCIIATNEVLKDPKQQQVSRTVYPGRNTVNGRIFSLEWETGRLQWTQMISHQQMRVDQPSDAPVLVACNRRIIQRQIGGQRKYIPPQLVTDCFDVRTGKLHAHHETSGAHIPNYALEADPQARTATLATVAGKVTFSQQPDE